MAYIVVYQATEGRSGYEPCDTLQSAILAAERMRNVDAVETPRIFRTEEVHFDFRPYYRIEVANDVPPVPAESTSEPSIEALLADSTGDSESNMNDVKWPGGMRESPTNGDTAPDENSPAGSGLPEATASADTDAGDVESSPVEVASVPPTAVEEVAAGNETAVVEDSIDEKEATAITAEAPEIAEVATVEAAEESDSASPLEMAELADSVISPRRGLFGR